MFRSTIYSPWDDVPGIKRKFLVYTGRTENKIYIGTFRKEKSINPFPILSSFFISYFFLFSFVPFHHSFSFFHCLNAYHFLFKVAWWFICPIKIFSDFTFHIFQLIFIVLLQLQWPSSLEVTYSSLNNQCSY